MNRNTGADARNKVEIDPVVYQDALTAFLTALGIDDETAFEVTVGPDRAVVKHVRYEVQENGVHSGDFWEDIVSRGNRP